MSVRGRVEVGVCKCGGRSGGWSVCVGGVEVGVYECGGGVEVGVWSVGRGVEVGVYECGGGVEVGVYECGGGVEMGVWSVGKHGIFWTQVESGMYECKSWCVCVRKRGIFCMRVECVRGVHVGVCVFIWS